MIDRCGTAALAALVCGAATAASCGGGTQFTDAHCPNGIAAAATVTVTAGRPFTLALRANHTTPYHWVLAVPPDPAIVRLSGSVYRSDRSSKPLAGIGGVECWTFDAVAPGETAFGFVNRRVGATPVVTPGGTPQPPDTIVHVAVR